MQTGIWAKPAFRLFKQVCPAAYQGEINVSVTDFKYK